MTESAEVSRRDFVTVVVGAVGAVMVLCVGIPAIAYLVSPALKVKRGKIGFPAVHWRIIRSGYPHCLLLRAPR